MKKQAYKIRQSSMFLIELIITLLFLSLCSVICIRLFVNARLTAKESYNLTNAVTASQNIAEVFEAGVDYVSDFSPDELDLAKEAVLNYMNEQFVLSEISDYKLIVYYDENFKICSSDEAEYISSVALEASDFIISADITVSVNNSDSIYSLHTDNAVNINGGGF